MAPDPGTTRPDGIAGVSLPGGDAVGEYAAGFKGFLGGRPRVQIFGEIWNLRIGRGARSTSSCATPTARCRAELRN